MSWHIAVSLNSNSSISLVRSSTRISYFLVTGQSSMARYLRNGGALNPALFLPWVQVLIHVSCVLQTLVRLMSRPALVAALRMLMANTTWIIRRASHHRCSTRLTSLITQDCQELGMKCSRHGGYQRVSPRCYHFIYRLFSKTSVLYLRSKFLLVLARLVRSRHNDSSNCSTLNPSATLGTLPSRTMPSLPWHGCQKMRHRCILSPPKRQCIWRVWSLLWPAARRPFGMHTISCTVRTADHVAQTTRQGEQMYSPWGKNLTITG